MPFHLLQHPLASHLVTHLRDKTTKPATFRTVAYQLSLLLAIESTRDLGTAPKEIETPLEPVTGTVLSQNLVVVPILRAGLGMVQPFLDLFPDVSVGYIGLERDHETAQAKHYYCKLPPLHAGRVIIVDPMLATGGSASEAVRQLKAAGARQITLASVLAAPEGIARLQADHPDLRMVVAAIDRQLNERGYILPGLGDAGDRIFGTA